MKKHSVVLRLFQVCRVTAVLISASQRYECVSMYLQSIICIFSKFYKGADI